MARQNLSSQRVMPATTQLLTLEVLRRERLSPHVARVTLGGGDVDRFAPMGFDQWFRLFLPVVDDGARETLARMPQKMDMLSYARYLRVSKAERPVLRNYTVRAFRPDGPQGPELDVDVVLHGEPGEPGVGPAATWAQTCSPGDVVAILDEGISFSPPPDTRRVLLVADETGLPAVAGILGSLADGAGPTGVGGHAVVEVPHADDRQDLRVPDGVELSWVIRDAADAVPGAAALAAAEQLPVPGPDGYGWTVGESALPVALRRHWVRAGLPKQRILFCGYWRAGRAGR